jgi:hypothetical protein
MNDLKCPGCCSIKNADGSIFVVCIHRECVAHPSYRDEQETKNVRLSPILSECLSCNV